MIILCWSTSYRQIYRQGEGGLASWFLLQATLVLQKRTAHVQLRRGFASSVCSWELSARGNRPPVGHVEGYDGLEGNQPKKQWWKRSTCCAWPYHFSVMLKYWLDWVSPMAWKIPVKKRVSRSWAFPIQIAFGMRKCCLREQMKDFHALWNTFVGQDDDEMRGLQHTGRPMNSLMSGHLSIPKTESLFRQDASMVLKIKRMAALGDRIFTV